MLLLHAGAQVLGQQKGWDSRKGGTAERGWGHPQGSVHMTAVRLSCKSNMVGTGWANSRPGCMSRLIKCHSHPLRGSFLAGKDCHAVWVDPQYQE